MNCVFCNIVNKQLPASVLYEDDTVLVFPDIHPQASVHLLIIPKHHYPSFIELPEQTLANICAVTKKIIEQQSLSGYRLVSNNKEAALIPHFHLHLLGQLSKHQNL